MKKFRTLAPWALIAILGVTPLVRAADAPPADAVKPARGEGRLKKLAEELNLTDDQKTQIKPILADSATARKAIRDDAALTKEQKRDKIMTLQKDTQTKLDAILTDEQKKKLADLQAERKKNMGKDKKEKPVA